jgi:hypothetical protein
MEREARVGDKCTQNSGRKLEEKRACSSFRLRWKVNSRRILKKQECKLWAGFTWLRIEGPAAGSCDHGDEPSDSIKFWEIRV